MGTDAWIQTTSNTRTFLTILFSSINNTSILVNVTKQQQIRMLLIKLGWVTYDTKNILLSIRLNFFTF